MNADDLTTPAESALVLPESANLAVLAPDGHPGAWRIQVLPRWMTSSLGLPHRFPMAADPSREPLGPAERLASLANDIRTLRISLADYLMEFADGEGGECLSILVEGRWEDQLPSRQGAGGGVVLSLRNVTEIVRMRRRAAAVGAFHGLIGQSLPMLELYHRIATYGPTEAPVLITGETGTGKELVARAMHERSRRARSPFVAVNCSALTSELFESELFGHEKGSFTGAFRQHRGRFERADGGTLFLDEIGDMPAMSQAKMLRALEEGVIERVGGEREQRVDVRIIAATNVALEKSVQERRFRADLYHRISVLRVHVPALREREGDIPLLVDYFLDIFNRRYEKAVRRFSPEALKILEEYHWPGNVRELRNVVERLVVESAGEAIGTRALSVWMEEREFLMPGSWNADAVFLPRKPIYAAGPQEADVEQVRGSSGTFDAEPLRFADTFWGEAPSRRPPSARRMIEAEPLPPVYIEAESTRGEDSQPVEITRESILDAYRAENGNLTRAAERLGVHKATLYRHLKRFGMTRDDLEAAVRETAGSQGGEQS